MFVDLMSGLRSDIGFVLSIQIMQLFFVITVIDAIEYAKKMKQHYYRKQVRERKRASR